MRTLMSKPTSVPSAYGGRFRISALAGGAAVGVSLGFGTGLGHLGRIPPALSLAAGVGAALALAAAAIAREARRSDVFSPLALTAVFVALSFGGGSVYFWFAPGPKYSPLFTHADLVTATWFGVAAFVFFVAGYEWLPLRMVSSLQAREQPVPRSVFALFVVGWAARLELVATHRYFHVSSHPLTAGGFSWITATVALAPMLATAYLGAASMRSRNRLGMLFWVLFVIEVAWYLPTGERAKLAMLLAVTGCLHYYGGGRRIPWRVLAPLATALVVFAFPFAVAYRGTSTSANRQSTSASLSRALHEMSFHPAAAVGTGFTVLANRLSDVASVAVIVHRGRIPGIATVSDQVALAVGGFVPRALVPSKADPAQFANRFGRAYGLAAPTDDVTSVPSTDFGALYISGGVAFSLICMIFIGAGYRLLSDILRTRRHGDPAAIALYAVLSYTLIRAHEAVPAEGIIAVMKTLLVLGFTLIVVLRAHPRTSWTAGSIEGAGGGTPQSLPLNGRSVGDC